MLLKARSARAGEGRHCAGRPTCCETRLITLAQRDGIGIKMKEGILALPPAFRASPRCALGQASKQDLLEALARARR